MTFSNSSSDPHLNSMTVTIGGNTTSSGVNITHQDGPSLHTAHIVMLWTTTFLVITLNLMVFVVLPKMKTVRANTKYGILSLAIADFCMGLDELVWMVYNTYGGYKLYGHHPLCIINATCQTLFGIASILSLTFMNFDRLLIFAFPLRYQLTKRQVMTIYGTLWLTVVVVLVPFPILKTTIHFYEHAFWCLPHWVGDLPYKLVIVIFLFAIPSVMIVISFCGSFYFARSRLHQNSRKALDVRVHHGCTEAVNKESQFKRDYRIFKVLAIMTFGFYIAWFPYFVTMAMAELITGHTLHPLTDIITPILAASNSFWNPIIYILTLRPFQAALGELCGCKPSSNNGELNKGHIMRPAYDNRGTSDEAITERYKENILHCTKL